MIAASDSRVDRSTSVSSMRTLLPFPGHNRTPGALLQVEGGLLPQRVDIGKRRDDAAEARPTENRIGECVGDDVGAGVAEGPGSRRWLAAAPIHRPPFDEP